MESMLLRQRLIVARWKTAAEAKNVLSGAECAIAVDTYVFANISLHLCLVEQMGFNHEIGYARETKI